MGAKLRSGINNTSAIRHGYFQASHASWTRDFALSVLLLYGHSD